MQSAAFQVIIGVG